jgi:hypothetical protein
LTVVEVPVTVADGIVIVFGPLFAVPHAFCACTLKMTCPFAPAVNDTDVPVVEPSVPFWIVHVYTTLLCGFETDA